MDELLNTVQFIHLRNRQFCKLLYLSHRDNNKQKKSRSLSSSNWEILSKESVESVAIQIKSLLRNKGRTSISLPRLNHPITAVGITLRLPITTTSANHKRRILLRSIKWRCLDLCRVRRRALTCTCAGAAAGRRPWPWPGWSASRNSAGRSCSTVWWPVWWRSTGTPSPAGRGHTATHVGSVPNIFYHRGGRVLVPSQAAAQ